MHIYTIMFFITAMFQEILLSSFSGVVLTKCFSNIFHFGQISNFKKGHNSEREKKISYGYAHLHIMSFITINFHEILLRGLKGVVLTNCLSSIFHFVQISKLKKRPKATPICNLVLRIFQTKKVRREGVIILLILFFILEIKMMRRAITIKINVFI